MAPRVARSDRRESAAPIGLAAVLLLTTACGTSSPPPESTGPSDAPVGPGLFHEVTGEIGLDSTREAWEDGTFFLPEIMGPGVAAFDHDSDGDLDLLQIRMPPPGSRDRAAPNRLFERRADGSYREVTDAAGLDDPGFGQGVAVGDLDNDGDLDVYVTNYGPDALYLNDGTGRFDDVTDRAGIGGDLWSSSAAFCDIDRDGDLDLYVAHYLALRPRAQCVIASGAHDYCGPQDFDGVADTLYRNDGDGTFTDVSAEAGIAPSAGSKRSKGLGVLCADLTGDGWLDFYVANDQEANELWANRGDGTFREEAILRGLAVNRHGSAESSMGVALGDITGDGRLDLFLTHLAEENNTIYRGTDGGMFVDSTVESGMSGTDLGLTGFGTGFLDYDLDGDLDLAVVNGRVTRGPARSGTTGFWSRYVEPDLLFENDGSGSFGDVGSLTGAFGDHLAVSRGLVSADLDDDGDLDLIVSHHDNSIRVFRNDAPVPGRHWLRVRALRGVRDDPGAVVRLGTGGVERVGVVQPATSYMTSGDPRVHFGLGPVTNVDWIEVRWADGRTERYPGQGVDRDVVVVQGQGTSP